jgi:hypothetical protein
VASHGRGLFCLIVVGSHVDIDKRRRRIITSGLFDPKGSIKKGTFDIIGSSLKQSKESDTNVLKSHDIGGDLVVDKRQETRLSVRLFC